MQRTIRRLLVLGLFALATANVIRAAVMDANTLPERPIPLEGTGGIPPFAPSPSPSPSFG